MLQTFSLAVWLPSQPLPCRSVTAPWLSLTRAGPSPSPHPGLWTFMRSRVSCSSLRTQQAMPLQLALTALRCVKGGVQWCSQYSAAQRWCHAIVEFKTSSPSKETLPVHLQKPCQLPKCYQPTLVLFPGQLWHGCFQIAHYSSPVLLQVHAANGYIIDQFWKDNTNIRTDEYGGSTPNKARWVCTACDLPVCDSPEVPLCA